VAGRGCGARTGRRRWSHGESALRGARPWSRWLVSTLLVAVACTQNPNDPEATDDEFTAARSSLLRDLHAQGVTDARVLAALSRVPRHEFVRPQDRPRAYVNRALPIGRGQTISQPYIVALMTQLLETRRGGKILEVGTGSGYQAAVLAALGCDVYSIEIDPHLAESARERLRTLGFGNVHVRAGDGFYGWEEAAPFDGIIVTAAAPHIPERLVAQLKPGGRLVMPLTEAQRQVLIRATKVDDTLSIERWADVLFVPMTGVVRTPTAPHAAGAR